MDVVLLLLLAGAVCAVALVGAAAALVGAIALSYLLVKVSYDIVERLDPVENEAGTEREESRA